MSTTTKQSGAVKANMKIKVRKQGTATSTENLKGWSKDKLRNQIIMQIRSDYGGRSPVKAITDDMKEEGIKITPKVATAIANVISKQMKGSRGRVTTKVNELASR